MERSGKKLRFQSNLKSAARSASGPSVSLEPSTSMPDKEELLKLVEQEEGGDSLDEAALKKIILNFDKRVLKNQELRVKFPDAPEK